VIAMPIDSKPAAIPKTAQNPIREGFAAAFTRKPGASNTFDSQTKFTTKLAII